MRALVLVVFSSGGSLLFDGGDLHGSHARAPDLGMTTTAPDMPGPPPRDLASTPTSDMKHGFAFGPAVVYSTGFGVADLAFGHFNGAAAKHLDAALVGHSANQAFVLTNHGDGTFGNLTAHPDADFGLFLGNGAVPLSFTTTIRALTAGSQTAAVSVADLNGDGASDAVLSNSTGAPVLVATKPLVSPPFTVTTYFPVAMYPGGAGTTVLGALTAGGKPDLLAVIFDSNAMMPGNQIQILRNDGDANFPGTPQVIPSDPSTSYIAVGDFDGDGRPDIAFNSSDLGRVGIALQNPDATFKPAMSFTVPAGIVGLDAVDLDGDGRIDLALPSATAKGLVVLLNRST